MESRQGGSLASSTSVEIWCWRTSGVPNRPSPCQRSRFFLLFYSLLHFLFSFSFSFHRVSVGWAAGRIVRLYYSEPNWPQNMFVEFPTFFVLIDLFKKGGTISDLASRRSFNIRTTRYRPSDSTASSCCSRCSFLA